MGVVRTYASALPEETLYQIKERYLQNRNLREVAKEFGLSHETVRKILMKFGVKLKRETEYITKICKNCLKEFKFPKRKSFEGRNFCCTRCYFEWRKSQTHVKVRCAFCGVEFYVSRKYIENPRYKRKLLFHSRECYNKWRELQKQEKIKNKKNKTKRRKVWSCKN